MRSSSLFLVVLLVLAQPIAPAEIVVEGDCTLVDAITAANSDAATGGCIAGDPGLDTIILTADVTLIKVDNIADWRNGLPSVTSEITVEGNGFSVARDEAAPNFRVFHVADGGSLDLRATTITNGSVSGAPGGGIFVRGNLAMSNATVSGNSAFYGGYGAPPNRWTRS